MNKISIYEDTENKILGNLLRTPLESKSMHQIAEETKLSYVTVFKIIPILLKKELIKLEKKGMSSLISVDLEKADISKLSSAVLYEKRQFLRKHLDIRVLLNNLEEALSGLFYILILFGSYAKGTYKKNSDLDLLFVVPDRKMIEKFKDKVNKVLELNPKKNVDIGVVIVEDLKEMLNQKYTVGRAAFTHGIVLFCAEHYYSLVKEYVKDKGY